MSEVPFNQRLSYEAVIFDLDGVITNTALIHSASWKIMFDEYLKSREQREGEPFQEFTYQEDYRIYVDGKPRYKGVQSFLESRGIHIPWGSPEDEPSAETVCGLGNQKNIKFRECLETKGVDIFPAAVTLIEDLIAKGVPLGVASSSKNCQFVLKSAKIEHYFQTRVDGIVSAELGLHGKPAADIFVKAAENMGAAPAKAVVVEDAVSGVQAGVNGGFGLVLGVAREGNASELKAHGADVVVESFQGVTAATINEWFAQEKKSKE